MWFMYGFDRFVENYAEILFVPYFHTFSRWCMITPYSFRQVRMDVAFSASAASPNVKQRSCRIVEKVPERRKRYVLFFTRDTIHSICSRQINCHRLCHNSASICERWKLCSYSLASIDRKKILNQTYSSHEIHYVLTTSIETVTIHL